MAYYSEYIFEYHYKIYAHERSLEGLRFFNSPNDMLLKFKLTGGPEGTNLCVINIDVVNNIDDNLMISSK